MHQGNQIDLKTQAGARSVTVTPGNSVQYTFNTQKSRLSGGLWNTIRGIMISVTATIVRSSGGATALWADSFPRVIKSIGLTTPMFGTWFDPTVLNGMIAKHFYEFFTRGYIRSGINQGPIAGVDATYTRRFEIYLPFAQFWNAQPDHFNLWLGWMDDAQLEIFVEDAAQPFGVSGITITNCVFKAGLDMVPMSEIIIPPVVTVRRYEQSAGSSSNGPTLTNVGSAGALQGVEDASRLLAMIFSHNTGGFVGSGTADQVQSITLPWRDQDMTLFPDQFFFRYLNTSHRLPKMGAVITGATTASDITDTASPYPLPNTAGTDGTTTLAAAASFFTPLVWPELEGLMSQFQKVKGNYPLDMVFGAAQSNVFRTYTLEGKQFAIDKASEMLSSMGVNPSAVTLVPKLARKNFKPIDASKLWCLPRSVISK